ncbi:hypothetical protein JOQ06_028040, partial [Pogonophryne albipinna]
MAACTERVRHVEGASRPPRKEHFTDQSEAALSERKVTSYICGPITGRRKSRPSLPQPERARRRARRTRSSRSGSRTHAEEALGLQLGGRISVSSPSRGDPAPPQAHSTCPPSD